MKTTTNHIDVMIEKAKKTPNLLILISTMFFLFTSAFTLLPNSAEVVPETEVIEATLSTCQTCNFGASGPPSGTCAPAMYCGLNGPCYSGSPCDMYGSLCGECAEGGGPGDGPVLIGDPGTP